MQAPSGHVTLIATGGTISHGPEGRLGASSLIRLASSGTAGLPEGIPVRGVDLSSVPSSCVTTESIEDLARAIREALARGGCLGVVVTHGTDTLEEVSFACELLLGDTDAPVVFTGAMVPPSVSGTDAHANLSDAVALVCCPSPRFHGVGVVMHHRVHAPIEVRKMSTDGLAAFSSPTHGPIGWLSPGQIQIVREAPRLVLATERLEPRVHLIRLAAGSGDGLIRAIAPDAAGLVVELFGAGNAGEDVCSAIREATDRGTAVLVTSRVGLGGLTPGTGVLTAGAIPAIVSAPGLGHCVLDGLKARVALMAALGAGLNREAIAALFAPDAPPAV